MTAWRSWARRLRGPLLAAAPAVIALLLLPFLAHIRAKQSVLFSSELWGLILLCAFVGWGGLLNWLVLPTRMFDWGLQSALGLSVVLAFGGVAQLDSGATQTTSLAIVVLGLLAFIGVRAHTHTEVNGRLRRRLATAHAEPMLALAAIVLYAAAATIYFGNVAHYVADTYDDLEAYIPFAKSLLQTGSLDQPFSLRRMASLGGQTYLHSLYLPFSSTTYLNGVDGGFCFLSLFGLVIGSAWGRGTRARIASMIAALFLVTLTFETHNTACTLSGSVFFFALFRLLSLEFAESREIALLLAFPVAAAWTLRQNFIVSLSATVGLAYGFAAIGRRQHWRLIAGNLARVMAGSALLLAPWWWATYRSSGSFLFPLWLGNARADCGLLEKATLLNEVRFFRFVLDAPYPVRTIGLFLLAGLCLKMGRSRLGFTAVLWGTLIGAFATIHALVEIDEINCVNRYMQPYLLAFVLAVIVSTLGALAESGIRNTRAVIASVLTLLAFALQIQDSHGEFVKKSETAFEALFEEYQRPEPYVAPIDAPYKEIQAVIPAGVRFLSVLDNPQYFDFSRNQILIADQPGRASPGLGLPIYGTADDYLKYFKSQHIRYIAYIWGAPSPEYFEQAWYNHERFTAMPRTGESRGVELAMQGRLYLDFFARLTELRKTHKVLYRQNEIYVVDLAETPDAT